LTPFSPFFIDSTRLNVCCCWQAFNVSHQTVGEEGDDSELPSVDVIAVLMGAMNGGLTKCGKKVRYGSLRPFFDTHVPRDVMYGE
jgi:hypothetical protein